jgi:UDP-N-acetylglucosamine--N-acetylmuramyl-(pentapeptide) pyrophosphoryl-undecaprenol N-acetylglucosamine transferase
VSDRRLLGVVFAGGGTGGHIQPNLAIAEELALLMPGDVSGVFITSDRPIDASVLKDVSIDGFDFSVVESPAKPLAMRPRAFARFVMSWGGSVRAGREAIRQLKSRCDRVVVVSTGGFVSPGVAQAARVERVASVLVNLDAVPGKANKLMQRWATRQLSSAPTSDSRLTRIAPIVRRRMHDLPSASEARSSFGLDASKKTLLVTGGSQGASTVNLFVAKAIERLKDSIDVTSWQILHQCGSEADEELIRAYARIEIQASVHAYIDRMDLAFAAADAAVTRGGAGAMSDVWATGTPALVLPYPYHRDEHQRENAQELEALGGVSVGTDKVEVEENLRVNLGGLESLMCDETRSRMSVAINSMGPADGAAVVARYVLQLSETESLSE